MSTSEPNPAPSPEWELPLAEFIDLLGVQTTFKQRCLIDTWLQKHNKRQYDAVVDLERAKYRVRQRFISLS